VKTHSRLLALPVAVAAMVAGTLAVAAPAQAAETLVSIDSIDYTLQPDGTAAVTRYRTAGGSPRIASTVAIGGQDRDVTTVKAGVFDGTFLQSVKIGRKITTIESRAFAGNDLTSVTVPTGVTAIGSEAFDDNPDLTTVTLLGPAPSIEPAGDEGSFGPSRPDLTLEHPAELESSSPPGYTSPTWAGYRSAASAPTFTAADGSVYAANNAGDATVIRYDGDGGQVRVPDVVTIGSSTYDVTSIDAHVFEQEPVTGIVLGNNVTTIGEDAFARTQLGAVALPDSIDTISDGAFGAAGITALTFDGPVSVIGSGSFVANPFTELTIPSNPAGTTIGAFAFGDGSITRLTLGQGITTIPDGAFFGNEIDHIVVPAGVTSIGESAFNQNGATTLTLTEGLVSIGSYAFFENPITDVTIPASVTEIGANVFQESLRTVTLLGPPPRIAPSEVGSFGVPNDQLVLSVPAVYAASATRPDGYTVPIWQGYRTVFFGQAPAAPAPPAAAPVPAPSASIAGSAQAGRTLTASTGLPSGTDATYQWKADGRTIKGATGPTLKLGKKQAARRITVIVTAGGKVSTSKATAVVTSKRARLVVSPTRIGQRDAFRVTAVGLRKNQKIRVWLGGRRVLIGKADRRGVVDRTVRFSTKTDAGKRRVRVSGYDKNDQRTYTITKTVRYLSR
jgi:hypothetical protein